MLVVRIVLYNH